MTATGCDERKVEDGWSVHLELCSGLRIMEPARVATVNNRVSGREEDKALSALIAETQRNDWRA